ncbi:sensor histidine kinase [Labedella endophytica]|nr:histidine kinase [Labedella endophytica]
MRAAFPDLERSRLPAETHRWRRAHAVVGDVAAALIIVAFAFAPFASTTPRGVVDLAILLAPAVLLPFRRRWPIPVLAACILLYAAAVVNGLVPPGIVVGAAIAMFGVANRMGRRRSIIVTASAIGAVVGLTLLAALGDVGDPRVVQFAITIAFFAAAGDATRSRREYIAAMVERAERAERTREAEAQRRVSEERLRIARDLHDVVAHQISVISLNAGVASSSLTSRPERAEEALGTIRVAARTVLGEIGDLLAMLRADGDETNAAPQQGLDALDALVAEFAAAGLDVRVRIEGDVDGLPATADVVAYRVIQEGLTNALKHGAEHRAHVLVAVSARAVEVVVANPVRVLAPDRSDPDETGGYGLLGLRERVTAVRGTLEAGPSAGGFRLSASIPLSTETEPRPAEVHS